VVKDDQYNPAQTVQLTRQLVEQDRVFAIVGGLGTEQQLAVRQYMNQRKVPQLYVSTGATIWGAQHRRNPWTIGWQPDYDSVGFAFGNYIRRFDPQGRIAVLMQNDDYGKDYLRGLQRGLRGGTARIVAQEAYEVGTPSVAPHVSRLRASNANVFVVFAIPQPTIQALVVAHRLGWNPTKYVNDVSATDTFLTLAQTSAGSVEATRGVITATYLKDPAAPKYQNDATVRLYKRLMAKYAPGANVNNALHFYGMAKADHFVQVLYRAGRNPTRASLMNAARNLKMKSPWLLPGTQVHTRPAAAFPISTVKLQRWNGSNFVEFGPLIKTRG
jgi:branched-chain amino acid transport system substrate-binding protein